MHASEALPNATRAKRSGHCGQRVDDGGIEGRQSSVCVPCISTITRSFAMHDLSQLNES